MRGWPRRHGLAGFRELLFVLEEPDDADARDDGDEHYHEGDLEHERGVDAREDRVWLLAFVGAAEVLKVGKPGARAQTSIALDFRLACCGVYVAAVAREAQHARPDVDAVGYVGVHAVFAQTLCAVLVAQRHDVRGEAERRECGAARVRKHWHAQQAHIYTGLFAAPGRL